MMNTTRKVVVLIGPTAVGKTDLSIEIAKKLNTEIVSADSRQIYQNMSIGTAVPQKGQLAAVKHHFIEIHPPTELYSAGRYEREALEVISSLHRDNEYVVVTGGSGMYIDALCDGLDDIGGRDETIRKELNDEIEKYGLSPLIERLRVLDPQYTESLESTNNRSRIVRALEVCLTTGKKYSDLRLGTKANRPFEIIKIGLERDREELYQRANLRVDMMVNEGLIEEVRNLEHLRSCNALQTVGYREVFDYFDGTTDLEEAIELIKRNTRRYAKRQMTWFRRDKSTKWFHPEQLNEILNYIKNY